MHQARLDLEHLQIVVVVGPNDKYEPQPKLVKLHNKLSQCKKELDDYVSKTFSITSQKELEELFKDDKEAHSKFLEYVKDNYLQELESIKEEVKRYNQALLDQ